LGDSHSDGRTTSVVKLNNGTSFIIKPNQTETVFVINDIFNWLNKKITDNYPLKTGVIIKSCGRSAKGIEKEA